MSKGSSQSLMKSNLITFSPCSLMGFRIRTSSKQLQCTLHFVIHDAMTVLNRLMICVKRNWLHYWLTLLTTPMEGLMREKPDLNHIIKVLSGCTIGIVDQDSMESRNATIMKKNQDNMIQLEGKSTMAAVH